VVACAGAALGAVPAARAQIELERLDASRPASAERVVRAFDFEERDTNPLEVPFGWFRGQSDPGIPRERAGFPVWNRAVLDFSSPARSGIGSVRLPVEGGSTSLMLSPGLVSVFPGADYRVTAWVRVLGVEHGAARLIARLLTQAGEPIAGSQTRSELVRASAWTPVRIDVMGDHPEAAFIQVELQLLQPRQVFESLPDLAFRIWPQDYRGSAWFDDVSIVQLPRAELAPTGTGGVFIGAGDAPTFDVLVRDLAGQSITVRAEVRDLDGVVIDRAAWTLGGGTLRERWTPRLDRYGWYEGSIEVVTGGTLVGRGSSAALWVPAGAGSARPDADRRRFSLIAERLPEGVAREFPHLAAAAGVGAVTLPVWSRSQTAEGHAASVRELAGVVDRLLGDWRDVTLALDRPPTELAMLAGDVVGGVPGLLSRPESVWGPYTTPYLDRFGQRVRRWQVGALEAVGSARPGPGGFESGSATGPTLDPGLLDSAGRALGVLVPGPVMLVPWSSDAGLVPQLAAEGRGVVMEVVPGTAGPGFDVLAQDWAALTAGDDAADGSDGASGVGLDQPELTLAMRPGDVKTLGRRGAAAELARRTIEAWIALGTHERPGTRVSLALIDPWELGGRRGDSAQPRAELGVWRTVIEHLAGARAVTRLPTARGVEAWLFAPSLSGPAGGRSPRGTIIAWRRDAERDPAPLPVFIHDQDTVRATDIFANPVPIQRPATTDSSRVEPSVVMVGDAPVFIEGVDAELVRFLSSVRLDPEFVPAQAVTHRHEMVIDNPWSVPIRGRLFLLEPGGYAGGSGRPDRSWRIDPRILPFAVGAGETARIPIDIAFGAGQRAGPSPMVLDVELTAGRTYPLMRFERDIELGLPGIELVVSAVGVAGADGTVADVLVRAEVTNSGDKPLDVELIAAAPGVARAKAFISRLAPGETAVRKFPMPGAYATLRGQEIAVGLIEPEGKGHLNASARVD
jgi:hypothetical protein